MANCADNSYTIYYTNLDSGSIQIRKSALITDEFDIALIGKTRLEYGEIFNENLLHVLEHFAVEEDGLNPGNPDLALTFGDLLSHPTTGQIWYNKTQERPFIYIDGSWVVLASLNDAGGNSGVIAHGEQIPLPVKPNGDAFDESECVWTVSPFFIDSEFDFFICTTDVSRNVTAQYRLQGTTVISNGFANFQIVGITENGNIGVIGCAPGPTPTPTPGISASASPVPTPTPTPTPI